MTSPSLRFPRAMRLSGEKAFDRVFAAKLRAGRGAIVVHGAANGLAHARLGLSVSRRVGNAAVRNRVKRLIREAFRLSQHELPRGLDLVVVARSARMPPLAECQATLRSAAATLARGAASPPAPDCRDDDRAADRTMDDGPGR